MLMIGKDMGMKSLSPLMMRSDALSEKITGNYRLMQYSVTAQDLFHMATVKPELYVGMENISTVCIEQVNAPHNTVKLEMMNQFLNRILCMSAPQFTYQDEVYITTVLKKLGIQDVKEFIKQIKAIRLQNELTVRLLGQYR